ncbi:MAG: carboxypeptidase-like regulatory domain-containing protein [Cyclobacteriaceae bacterium]
MKKIYLFLVLCLIFSAANHVSAQTRRVIQLSGIVTDTAGVPIPGVNFYVAKAGRGTSSLNNGFFSMPLLVGDTIQITCIGYLRQQYVVPAQAKEFTTILVEMHTDVKVLSEVIVMMPTEEIFKDAVLALNVPLDDTGIDQKNLNSELLSLMVRTTPMDGNANYRYYMDQYTNSFGNKFHPLYNPFLNPLNWVKFVKDLRKKKTQSKN